MSMLALPESECQEILALFRLHLPHVPSNWLEELAANYGLDAIADIDPNDVITILSTPGRLYRFQMPLTGHEMAEIAKGMFAKLNSLVNNPAELAAILLIIHDSSAKLTQLNGLIGQLISTNTIHWNKGWASYLASSNTGNSISMFFVVQQKTDTAFVAI